MAAMGSSLLARAAADFSPQLLDRVTTELQIVWDACAPIDDDPCAVAWLPVTAVATALISELGYEDMNEFEDALQGSFSDFLDTLPYVAKETQEDGQEYLRLLSEQQHGEKRAVRFTFTVNSGEDLWRVCVLSQHARVEIPELEFEICADGARHIDTIYSHIARALFNLGSCVDHESSNDYSDNVKQTVVALNGCLDVLSPWTFVVHDPSGMSEIKPVTGVLVDYLD